MMKEYFLELIGQQRWAAARNWLTQMNAVDIAQLLEDINEDSVLVVFRLLPKDLAAEVFTYMSYEQQEFIIGSIADREIKGILDRLFLDDTVDFLEEMPANIVKKVLKNATEDRRKLINQFLNYPENSAGGIMTIEYVDLKKEMTVTEALDHIRKIGVDKETINVCYVMDGNRKLEGVLPIRRLILSDQEAVVGDIMDTKVISIHTNDDQEEIASLFKKYDFLAMPVVDNENRLVGIITIDDIVDIIEQENTEDFHRMAAMAPSEQEYLKTNVFTLARHRVGWLLILMISATFTGNIVKRFEDVLQTVVVLTAFIPMLMDTGGNAGSQSATLIIRGLALEEIQLKDIFKVIRKELQVSIIVGVILSAANFLRIYYLEKTDIIISFVVSASLLFTVILAKVVGGALPILAKKMRLDPAIMASPLITTIVDAMALMAYFLMASRMLGL